MSPRRRRLTEPPALTYTWIDRQAEFDALVDELHDADRIAIDTEFHR